MPRLHPDDRALLDMIFEGDPKEDLLPFDSVLTRLDELTRWRRTRVFGIRLWFYALVLAPLTVATMWTWWPVITS